MCEKAFTRISKSKISPKTLSSFSTPLIKLRYIRGLKNSVIFATILILLYAFGISRIPKIKIYNLDVKSGMKYYPMDIKNFSKIVDLYRAGLLNTSIVKPINLIYSQVKFSVSPSVNFNLHLLVIVKSARKNFQKRSIIRQTWGKLSYLEEEIVKKWNISVKILFLCGQSDPGTEKDVELHLKEESDSHRDMIFADFKDVYRNNTYKLLLAFKWALQELKGHFKYLGLFDDDIYVDMEIIASFLKDIHLKRVVKSESVQTGFPIFQLTSESCNIPLKDITNGLYIGYVFENHNPNRNRDWKHFVSHEEYTYNKYPPYIPGPGIILDHKAVSNMYYASHFVQHFWIDDVYLGILAAKLGIVPINDDRSVIVEYHNFTCPEQIFDFWTKRSFRDLINCVNESSR